MIYFIVFIILFVYIFIRTNESCNVRECIPPALLGIATGLIVGFIGIFLIGSIVGLFIPTKTVVTESYIATTHDKEGKNKYIIQLKEGENDSYWYGIEEDGVIKTYNVNVDDCTVVISDEAKIVKQETVFKDSNSWWYAINSYSSTYTIYMPEETFIKTY